MKLKSFTPIFAFFLLLSFSQLDAQTSPISAGKMMLAGELSFANYGGDLYENDAKDKLTILSLHPSFGYFVFKGLQVGAMASYDNLSQGNYKETFIGVGPYVAYFMGSNQENGKGNTYPYVSVGFTYYTGSNESEFLLGEDVEKYKEDISGTGLNFAVGFMHMLTNSIGFDTGMSYHINSLKFEPKGEKGETLDGTTFTIGIGIVAFF